MVFWWQTILFSPFYGLLMLSLSPYNPIFFFFLITAQKWGSVEIPKAFFFFGSGAKFRVGRDMRNRQLNNIALISYFGLNILWKHYNENFLRHCIFLYLYSLHVVCIQHYCFLQYRKCIFQTSTSNNKYFPKPKISLCCVLYFNWDPVKHSGKFCLRFNFFSLGHVMEQKCCW